MLFYVHRLAVEVDEFGHCDRNTEYEKRRERMLNKDLNCKFIRINPGRENFNINKDINRIHRYIIESTKKLTEESTKKSVMNDIRVVLAELSLEFEKNTKTIHKFLRRGFKGVVRKA